MAWIHCLACGATYNGARHATCPECVERGEDAIIPADDEHTFYEHASGGCEPVDENEAANAAIWSDYQRGLGVER